MASNPMQQMKNSSGVLSTKKVNQRYLNQVPSTQSVQLIQDENNDNTQQTFTDKQSQAIAQVERLVWENQAAAKESNKKNKASGQVLSKVKTVSTLNHQISTTSMLASKSEKSNGQSDSKLMIGSAVGTGSKTQRRINSPTPGVVVPRINLDMASKTVVSLLFLLFQRMHSRQGSVASSSIASSTSSSQTIRQSAVLEALKIRELKSPSPESSSFNQNSTFKVDKNIIQIDQGNQINISFSPQVKIQSPNISNELKEKLRMLGSSKKTRHLEQSKAKAQQTQINDVLNKLYDASPFKRGERILIKSGSNIDDIDKQQQLISTQENQKVQIFKNTNIYHSIQSEDVLDTNEELLTQDYQPSRLLAVNPQSTPSAPPETTLVNQQTTSDAEFKDVGAYDSLTQAMLAHLKDAKNHQLANQRESKEFNLTPEIIQSIPYENQNEVIHQHQNNYKSNLNQIDLSLNRSHLTMEDNNKIQRKQFDDNKHESESLELKEEIKEEEVIEAQDPMVQMKSQEMQQERFFALMADQITSSYALRQETSFDTLNSADHTNYLLTQSEDQTLNTQRSQKKSSKPKLEEDDLVIERELKKISYNLNTFTVEHFNQLREHIQRLGFAQAATQAKHEFNLVTAESNNTLVSNQTQDLVEEGASLRISYPEEHNQIKIIGQESSENGQFLKKDEGPSMCQGRSIKALRRKIVICQVKEEQMIEVDSIIETTGFNCAPQIEYGENEKSRISVDCINSKDPLNAPIYMSMLSPSVLQLLIKSQVTLLSCGFEHCMILTQTGKIASWGCGASGALGHGNYISYLEPNIIQTGDFASLNIKITYIECGGYHNGAISEDNSLYTWGRSDVGQLGLTKNQVKSDDSGFVVLSPKKVEYFSERKVVQIALGEAHTLVLDKEGRVFSFGWGELGQLGISDLKSQSSSDFIVNKIESLENKACKEISAGAVFSCALTLDNYIYTWGCGQNGQLGLGIMPHDITCCNLPQQVVFPNKNQISEILCGESCLFSQTIDSSYYGWGQGVATSPKLIASLQGNVESDAKSEENRYQQQETMDVISFTPKLMTLADVHHPIILNPPNEISENVQDSLNSLQTVLIFDQQDSTNIQNNIEIKASSKKQKQISSMKKSPQQMVEPLKILQSTSDNRERSLSPEVASEKDSFIEYFEAPESSRVVEDQSDIHHRYHHQDLSAKIKGATLNMRNLETNIKVPHMTHQFQDRGSMTTPIDFNAQLSQNVSPQNNNSRLLELKSPNSINNQSGLKDFIVNRMTNTGQLQTSKEKLTQLDIFQGLAEFTNTHILEIGQIKPSISSTGLISQPLNRLVRSRQSYQDIQSPVQSPKISLRPDSRGVVAQYQKSSSNIKTHGVQKEITKNNSLLSLQSQNRQRNISQLQVVSNDLKTQQMLEDGGYQKTSSTKHFSSVSQYDAINFNSSLQGPSGSPEKYLKQSDSKHQVSIISNNVSLIDNQKRPINEENDETPTIAQIRRFQSPQTQNAKIFSGSQAITMVGKASKMRNINTNLQILNADSRISLAGSSPKSTHFSYQPQTLLSQGAAYQNYASTTAKKPVTSRTLLSSQTLAQVNTLAAQTRNRPNNITLTNKMTPSTLLNTVSSKKSLGTLNSAALHNQFDSVKRSSPRVPTVRGLQNSQKYGQGSTAIVSLDNHLRRTSAAGSKYNLLK